MEFWGEFREHLAAHPAREMCRKPDHNGLICANANSSGAYVCEGRCKWVEPEEEGPEYEDILRELHDAVIEYLAQFEYPTLIPGWAQLASASAKAAIALSLPGRFGDKGDAQK